MGLPRLRLCYKSRKVLIKFPTFFLDVNTIKYMKGHISIHVQEEIRNELQ